MIDAFGWVTTNRNGAAILPVFGTRIEAIHYAMAVMDGPYPPDRTPKALAPERAARWRQIKTKYGMSTIRVRVTPAFGEKT